MRLTSLLKLPPLLIRERLEAFFIDADIRIIPIEAEHATVAVEAFACFGKGRGHPAQLNLADCLSYACAKRRGVPLLYKGNDFSRTDLR
jgi:ribonuclease VapC